MPTKIVELDRDLNSFSKGSDLVSLWLIVCVVFIFMMIVLGGVTRLTHSGLSMVEWKPIMGAIPPLNEQQWIETFDKYQQFPEYQKINQSMNLAEFKSIFYFEYFHRLLGRFIGFIFLIPLLFFWIKGYLEKPILKNLGLIFVLGGAQGLLGWYMVKSGLVDDPHVNHYRLTAHLGLAVLLYGAVIWNALAFYFKDRSVNTYTPRYIINLIVFLPCLIYLMILSGGLVAGTHAGMMWNTFPLMGDTLIPSNSYSATPVWLSALSDPTTIQLNHRMLAYLIFFVATSCLILTVKRAPNPVFRNCVITFYIAVCCQIALGISTLLQFVPVSLSATHQAVAMVVFALSLIAAFLALRGKRAHAWY